MKMGTVHNQDETFERDPEFLMLENTSLKYERPFMCLKFDINSLVK